MNYQHQLCIKYKTIIDNTFYPEIVKKQNIKLFDKLYDFLRTISFSIYSDGHMHSSYRLIKQSIQAIEGEYREKYITDARPITTDETELDEIIKETRKYLYEENAYYREDGKTIVSYEEIMNTLNFVNQCGTASRKVKEICDRRGIKNRVMTIYPGYDKDAKLYGNTGIHKFNFIKYKGEYYIIDCTYRQFFTVGRNSFNRVGVVDSSGCKPGFFALEDEQRRKVAKQLLEKGYIKVEKEELKKYLDPFTLSYRNGIYYERTKDYSFQTEYSTRDYERFILGKDSQTRYEDRETLGYLKRPVKF